MSDHRNSGRHRRPLFAFRWALFGIAVALITRAFLAEVYLVPSESMEPTLQIGDRVLVLKVVRDISVGDVVAVDATDVWSSNTNGVLVVKRVAGVGGDHITCCTASGDLVRNGVVVHAPYAAGGQSRAFDVVVPKGRLWLLGDNRQHSVDSAANQDAPAGGSVPVNHVVGKVLAVVWPPSRAGILALPEVTNDAA